MWFLLSFIALGVAASVLLLWGVSVSGAAALSLLLLLLFWTRRIEVGPAARRTGSAVALLRIALLIAALFLAARNFASGAAGHASGPILALATSASVIGMLSRFLPPRARPITRSAARLSPFVLALTYHTAVASAWAAVYVALLALLSAGIAGDRDGTYPRGVALLEEVFTLGMLLTFYLPVSPLAVSAPLGIVLLGVDLRGAPKLTLRDISSLPGPLFSFLIYYAIPFRPWRLHRFYRGFLSPGETVFDVGAHIGNRVRAFRSIGARVIAIEPQQSCLGTLYRFYGSDREVVIMPVALGPETREARLKVSRKNPTMSTLSQEWIGTLQEHYSEQRLRWEQEEKVSLETLDRVIQRYGEPAFVKIDVEGYEPEVLKGLSTPVRAISIEFLPAVLERVLESLELLSRLGEYRYNYSFGERMRFASPEWLDYESMRAVLSAMKPRDPSGDVYAVRSGS